MTDTCDCPTGDVPCLNAITQEDMLCDSCRRQDCQRPSAEYRAMIREMKGQAEKMLASMKYVTVVDASVWTAPTGGEIVIPPQ